MEALKAIVDRKQPLSGAVYDDLGNPTAVVVLCP